MLMIMWRIRIIVGSGDTGNYLTSRVSQTANRSSGTTTTHSTVHVKVHLMCHSPKLIYLWGHLGNKHKWHGLRFTSSCYLSSNSSAGLAHQFVESNAKWKGKVLCSLSRKKVVLKVLKHKGFSFLPSLSVSISSPPPSTSSTRQDGFYLFFNVAFPQAQGYLRDEYRFRGVRPKIKVQYSVMPWHHRRASSGLTSLLLQVRSPRQTTFLIVGVRHCLLIPE